MTQGKEVKGTHPDTNRSHGKSDLTVEDHPVESLENHNSENQVDEPCKPSIIESQLQP